METFLFIIEYLLILLHAALSFMLIRFLFRDKFKGEDIAKLLGTMLPIFVSMNIAIMCTGFVCGLLIDFPMRDGSVSIMKNTATFYMDEVFFIFVAVIVLLIHNRKRKEEIHPETKMGSRKLFWRSLIFLFVAALYQYLYI